ncbi:VanZ like protein [Knoellia remsis]|uniref:VanZ like protein n=1 Tax=Knoellia remsis TaxID=407159 RepID=A0A2T0UZ45_9MICO|nr:VanZ family protein [Knoellia remsis]PRY63203.1 VanZ like protein [Knoellia remsis]
MSRAAARWLAGLVLTAYTVAIAALLLWPDAWSINRLNVAVYVWFLNRGVPPSMTPERWAVVWNVFLLAPLTFALALIAPRVRWWWWALLGLALSVGFEAAQDLIVQTRDASWGDVLANTCGAVAGAYAGSRLSARRAPR